MKVTTETGSVYEINLESKTWSRVPTEESGKTRTESGNILNELSIRVGYPMVIQTDRITEHPRFLSTSLVRSIEIDGVLYEQFTSKMDE